MQFQLLMELLSHETWNSDGWKCIDDHPKLPVAIANMMTCFVHQQASDGIPNHNFKDQCCLV